jgi:hypothetical protein
MKNILIIDDKQTEISKAVEVLKMYGWHPFTFNPQEYGNSGDEWIKMVPDIDGILTDLFWVPRCARGKNAPSGLLVVIHALIHNKPVVVCTSACDEDERWHHHGEAVGWLYDGYIRCIDGVKPFGWIESKDWNAACKSLKQMLERAAT